jgi:hypothetical protein
LVLTVNFRLAVKPILAVMTSFAVRAMLAVMPFSRSGRSKTGHVGHAVVIQGDATHEAQFGGQDSAVTGRGRTL